MRKARLRPFLDTNVIFAGLYSPGGPPAEILDMHIRGQVQAVISRQVLEELVRTIKEKMPDLLPALHQLLTNAPPELQPDPTAQERREAERLINAYDAPILAAAVATKPHCLVTGDTKHFTQEVARKAGLRILTPAEFVAEAKRLKAPR